MGFYSLLRTIRLPDVLIIGTQKGGTTSLAHYLAQHPQVVAPRCKEVHFFDLDYERGVGWYRSHFPVSVASRLKSWMHLGLAAIDASPYYLFHPRAAERAFQLLPHARIIIMLRDPGRRAYSHYQHAVRHGHEFLSFDGALEAEEARLSGDSEKFAADPFYRSFNHQHFSYVSRGMYRQQISQWLQFYSPQQVLVLSSELFFRNPAAEYRRVLDFLGLRAWNLPEYKPKHQGKYEGISPAVESRLCEFFEPHNESLREYLNSQWSGVGDVVVNNFDASVVLQGDKRPSNRVQNNRDLQTRVARYKGTGPALLG